MTNQTMLAMQVHPGASRLAITTVDEYKICRHINSVNVAKLNCCHKIYNHIDHLQDVDGDIIAVSIVGQACSVINVL